MKRPANHYWLALLVVWAFANDAWAAITADTSDDVVASADNVFLSASPRDRVAAHPLKSLLLAGAANAGLALPARPAVRTGSPIGRGPSLVSHPLFYLFMTLRR
jgi:hypothetical protein